MTLLRLFSNLCLFGTDCCHATLHIRWHNQKYITALVVKTCHNGFSPRMFRPVLSLIKTLPGRPQSLIFKQSAEVILRASWFNLREKRRWWEREKINKTFKSDRLKIYLIYVVLSSKKWEGMQIRVSCQLFLTLISWNSIWSLNIVFKCVKASKTLSAQGLCRKCRKSRLIPFFLSITIIIYLHY